MCKIQLPWYIKPVLNFGNQQKCSKNGQFIPKNWPILANSGIFCNVNIQNVLIKCQNWVNHRTEPKCVHKYYLNSLISDFTKIGTFWPFLAIFGIEIATKCWKMFFKYKIWLKTIYTSIRCYCTIHATLIFQHAYLGKTQKLSFLLIPQSKHFNFYKFQSGLA